MIAGKGAVAAGHATTAEAAVEILRDGGNAFDAVLAAMLTACVPEVVLSSVGGGGFLMAHSAANGRTVLYDFFANAPLTKRSTDEITFDAIHADFGPARQEFHIGAGSTAVPGFVQGLYAVHGDLCQLPVARLIEPAVRAARDGVEMTAFHAYLFGVIAPILTASKQAQAQFAPDGNLLPAGAVYRNPQFAETLEALARSGKDLFTSGEIGAAIVAQSRNLGGFLTAPDLCDYQVERRSPLQRSFLGSHVFLNPMPAAGGVLVAYGLELARQIVSEGRGIDSVGLAEIQAATNRARQSHGEDLSGFLVDDKLNVHLAGLREVFPSTRGTTHISVIDQQGNAAAATISNGEGNGLMVDGYGIMLNNMLGEQDLHPKGFHNWRPGARLSSMMGPTLVRGPDDSLTVLGSGGSNRIRSAILQVIWHLQHAGLTLDEAIRMPRLHVEQDGMVSYEGQFGEAEQARVVQRFPDAKLWPEQNMFFGGVHAVRRHSNGLFEAAGDPRRGGVALIV